MKFLATPLLNFQTGSVSVQESEVNCCRSFKKAHNRRDPNCHNRARQLYKNISMLFLFPVKTVSLVQASIHKVFYISLQ